MCICVLQSQAVASAEEPEGEKVDDLDELEADVVSNLCHICEGCVR